MCMLPPGEWRGEYSNSITKRARGQPKSCECASLRRSRVAAAAAAAGRALLYRTVGTVPVAGQRANVVEWEAMADGQQAARLYVGGELARAQVGVG